MISWENNDIFFIEIIQDVQDPSSVSIYLAFGLISCIILWLHLKDYHILHVKIKCDNFSHRIRNNNQRESCIGRICQPESGNQLPLICIFFGYVSVCYGSWDIMLVQNLDNFSNSLEQISWENKPLWENWKFIISYQWFSLSQSQACQLS